MVGSQWGSWQNRKEEDNFERKLLGGDGDGEVRTSN